MAGERTPGESRHLEECTQCAAEAARLDALFAQFRSSVTAWSASQEGAEAPDQWRHARQRRGSARSTLRWILAATALVIVVAVPVWKSAGNRWRETEAARTDALLWEEVNAQISRPVPASLEPLMKLISWEMAPAQK